MTDGPQGRTVPRSAGLLGHGGDPLRHRGGRLVGELGGGDAQHLEHESDVEIGEDARMEQHRAGRVDIQAQPSNLAAVDLQVVLAAKDGGDAKFG